MPAERIDPVAARAHIAMSNALLVCAYDSVERCRDNYLDGAITLEQLEVIAPRLARDQEIIFYCA